MDLIKKTQGSKAAIGYIITDEKAHSKELDTIKTNHFLYNDPKFKNFYTTINSLVLELGTYFSTYENKRVRMAYENMGEDYSLLKEIHYFRNRLNWGPSTLDELLKESSKWTLMEPETAAFHMHGTDGEYNLYVTRGTGLLTRCNE